MGNISIGGETFTDPSAVIGYTQIAGKYWLDRARDAPEYEIDQIAAPGVQGTLSIHKGFRTKAIRIPVMYVAASYDACLAAWDADVDTNLANAAFTVDTFENCQLSPSSRPTMDPSDTGYGNHFMKAELIFTQRIPNA